MSDLISRQEVIDSLKEKVFHNLTDEFYGAMQVLDKLPSADRPTGKWLKSDGTPYGKEPVESCWCSECGKWLVASDEYDVDNNYCPNCGARMLREDGENVNK